MINVISYDSYKISINKAKKKISLGKHWGCSKDLPIKAYKRWHCWDEEAKIIIERIRIWLMNHGKEKYADPDYLNIYNDTTVFIDLKDTEILDFKYFAYDSLSPL
ncbi:unnamed protein product [marine sediment metagenome]|uniref:Uncharacterized protein n=1 Tax=marine sediment metagenome TaxID=412755 RepID=X1R414_9ZZZZ